jgi:hypothetical protein
MSMFVAATGDGAVMLDGNAPPLELVEEWNHCGFPVKLLKIPNGSTPLTA